MSTATRTVVRLVDEIDWLTIVIGSPPNPDGLTRNPAACKVKDACAAVLERSAELLAVYAGNAEDLHAVLAELESVLGRMERHAAQELPVRRVAVADAGVSEVIISLDPSFRAQELSFAVSLIGRNVL